MGSLSQDVRFAIRTLVNHPGFTAVALVTLALGVGANTAIFSVLNGVLLKPLPVHAPGELAVPEAIAPHTGYGISLSIPNFRDWRERNRTFSSFGASASRGRTLTGLDRPEVIRTRIVLGDFFETLGVAPALGRTIPGEETWAGAPPVAVVTHGFWQRRLDGDPEALGRTLTLNGQPFTVVGIMPPDFVFPRAETEVYLPMGFYSEQMCWEDRGCSQGTWAIGRLEPGVSLEQAQADLDRVTREIAAEEGEEVATAQIHSLDDFFVAEVRGRIWLLTGAVGLVLLIACANVASLLLARGEGRRREVALRSALGAGRGRMLRQLLTESLLLALGGGLLGVGVAVAGTALLIPAMADSLPSALAARIDLDGRALLFTLGVSLAAGLLFGLAPALRASRSDLAGELREGGRGTAGSNRQRLRSAFVVAEVALSLVLLICAALMIESLTNLTRVDAGFEPENVFTAEVSLPFQHYPDKEAAFGLFRDFLGRVEALPGVSTASLTNIVPLSNSSWETSLWPEGVPTTPETRSSVLYHIISPGHFETLGVPILQGRGFNALDREGNAPVAIIDETMAQLFWPGEDPLGKRITFEEAEGSTDEEPLRVYRTVVGVAKNVRHYELESPSRVQVYVPMEQSLRQWTTSMAVLARTTGDPLLLTEPVRRELASLDPELPLGEIRTMEGYVADAVSGTRSVSGLLAAFGALALTLSAVGLSGLISFTVVQRLREIGIRMALGAAARDVVWKISGQGLRLTLAGVALGLAAAWVLTRYLAGQLYDVEPVSLPTFAGVSAFLVGVSLLAALLPARRATRVDPAIVLREE